MHRYVFKDDPYIGGAGMDDAAHFRDEPTDGRGNSRRRISTTKSIGARWAQTSSLLVAPGSILHPLIAGCKYDACIYDAAEIL